MFAALSDFTSAVKGDSTEFIKKMQALVVGVARDYEPVRLYVIRIDRWFGPKWMGFAGTFTAGKFASIGVHRTQLHVPPFVPHRVVAQRVFVGPDYEDIVAAAPPHIECPSSAALLRRIRDIDKDAVFVLFSGDSEAPRRGSLMVYLPAAFNSAARPRGRLRRSGAFYVGFSQREIGWEPAMLRGVSRSEVEHLEQCGRALIEDLLPTANQD